MQINSIIRKLKFAINRRKHIREYPYVSMIVLHHYFYVFGIEITKLDEKSIVAPEDATISESFPVYVYNAIYSGAQYLDKIANIEANIATLYNENNEWCNWMVNLYDNNVVLKKDELQEVALLSHDGMAKDYIQWELKVHVPIGELIEILEEDFKKSR
jgi:hypothetical protein